MASSGGANFIKFMANFIRNLTIEPNRKPFALQKGENPILPQPRILSHTLSTIEEAKKKVSETLDLSSILIAISQGHESIADEISNQKEILLEDLPDFPLVFPKSYQVKLVSGIFRNNKVMCLSDIPAVGIAAEEASYLIELFYELQVKMFIQTGMVATVDETQNPIGEVCQVTEYVDSSGTHVIPKAFLNSQFYDHHLLCQDKIDSFPQKSYFSYPGPSYPTPAEAEVVKIAKIDFTGCSTFPLLFGLSLFVNFQTLVTQTKCNAFSPLDSAKNFKIEKVSDFIHLCIQNNETALKKESKTLQRIKHHPLQVIQNL